MKRKPAKKIVVNSSDDQQLFRHQFENIYNTHFEKLFFYSKKITNSEEIAKDVVADVFLNLLNMHSDLSEINELESYLFVSVKNLSIHAISRDPRKFYAQDFESALKRIEGLNPEEVLIGKELQTTIEKAIENLPSQCQLVYHFVKVKGLKYRDVAIELDVAESTVRNQLIKAVAIIKEKVREHLADKDSSLDDYAYLGAIIPLLIALSKILN